jgi:hypothetical protein
LLNAKSFRSTRYPVACHQLDSILCTSNRNSITAPDGRAPRNFVAL